MTTCCNHGDGTATRLRRRRCVLPGRLLAGLLVVLAGGSSAMAEGREYAIRAHDLELTVDTRWAGCAHGGYYPVRIRVVNYGPSRLLQFRFVPVEKRGLPIVQRSVQADSNATLRFTLGIPLVGETAYGQLEVSADDERLRDLDTPIDLPATDSGVPRPSLIVVSPVAVDCDAFEQGVHAVQGGVYAGGYHYRGFGRRWYGAPRTADHERVPPDSLPDSWIYYSGIDLLAVSLPVFRTLPIDVRSAILAWVRTGGTLLVYDVGSHPAKNPELARLLDLDASSGGNQHWQEADLSLRKLVPLVVVPGAGSMGGAMSGATAVPPGVIPPPPVVPGLKPTPRRPEPANPGEFQWPGTPQAFVSRSYMMGQVFAFPENPFPGSRHDWHWFLQNLGADRFRWTQRYGISARQENSEFLQFLIPGVRGVPVWSYLTLITLFVLGIGPLNYFLLWRRRRLQWLVLSVPLIALVTSIGLFAYSAVAHGFGTRARLRSLTIVDEGSQKAVTFCRTALFAGMAPSQGLTFSTDTAVMPIWPPGRSFETGRVDWTNAQRLTSGFLTSRTRTQLLTVSHRDLRGRLEWTEDEDGTIRVGNGFEWDMEALLLARDDGVPWIARDLPAGAASITMQPAGDADLRDFVAMLRRHPLVFPEGMSYRQRGGLFDFIRPPIAAMSGSGPSIQFARSLMERTLGRYQRVTVQGCPPNTYIAVLRTAPDVETGLPEVDEQASLHILVGYLKAPNLKEDEDAP